MTDGDSPDDPETRSPPDREPRPRPAGTRRRRDVGRRPASEEPPGPPASPRERSRREWLAPRGVATAEEERTEPERERGRGERWGLRARPDADVLDHADEVEVLVDLPGCDEDEIELTGDDDTLYVRAERADEFVPEGAARQRERSRHAEREIHLPGRVDPAGAEATLDSGVLVVRLPKRESARKEVIGLE